jgi:ribosome-binding protein aMBF1 (putative translation factor)
MLRRSGGVSRPRELLLFSPRAGWNGFDRAVRRRIDSLPRPPSRDPRPRSERIPNSVLERYEALLDRVRAQRQALGLSQQAVAKMIGVSTSQFANIERGYSILSAPKLLGLADALNITAGALLGAPRRRR